MKTCVLFSGGWDSAACALIYRHFDPDLLFFSYGQNYCENELAAAQRFAQKTGMTIIRNTLELCHNHPRRNFYLISEAKRLGYGQIIIGSRNLTPLMDHFRDSNFIALRLYGLLMGVSLRLPITGWIKPWVVRYVRNRCDVLMYNCYENKTDPDRCSCRNCLEIRHLIK